MSCGEFVERMASWFFAKSKDEKSEWKRNFYAKASEGWKKKLLNLTVEECEMPFEMYFSCVRMDEAKRRKMCLTK